MSGFLGQALFDKNAEVRIFWSPDFKQTTVLYFESHDEPGIFEDEIWYRYYHNLTT